MKSYLERTRPCAGSASWAIPATCKKSAHGYGHRHRSLETLKAEEQLPPRASWKSGLSVTALISACMSTSTGLAPASPFSACQLLQNLGFGTNSALYCFGHLHAYLRLRLPAGILRYRQRNRKRLGFRAPKAPNSGLLSI